MLPPLPDIIVPTTDKHRLTAAADEAFRERLPIAPFLQAELRRATFCKPGELPTGVVTMGGWFRYRIDWEPASRPSRLVYPDGYSGEEYQIPLFSRRGVALLGLRVGDRMPFFSREREFRLICVTGIEPCPSA